jgi:hypothetical protein
MGRVISAPTIRAIALNFQKGETFGPFQNFIPNQEDHGFYPWVNWSSGPGCSPLMGVFWEL